MKSIYELDLHESTTETNFNGFITRVPGGWLYETSRHSNFVPFHNEFENGSELFRYKDFSSGQTPKEDIPHLLLRWDDYVKHIPLVVFWMASNESWYIKEYVKDNEGFAPQYTVIGQKQDTDLWLELPENTYI